MLYAIDILLHILIFAIGAAFGIFLTVRIYRSPHPFIAVLCGVVGLLCYMYFSPAVAILYFAVFAVLLCITLIDAATQEIPNSLNLALLLCGGIAAIWHLTDANILSRVVSLFAVSLPLLVIALAIRGAFGMGDVKLMFAAGFLLGWQDALVAFFIALILGGIYGVIVLAARKKGRKDHFAFGPCLAVGIFAALLAGERIFTWYLTMF